MIILKRKSFANSSFVVSLSFIIVKLIVVNSFFDVTTSKILISWKFFTNIFSFVDAILVSSIDIIVNKNFLTNFFVIRKSFVKKSFVNIISTLASSKFFINNFLTFANQSLFFIKNFFVNFATRSIVVIKSRQFARLFFSSW